MDQLTQNNQKNYAEYILFIFMESLYKQHPELYPLYNAVMALEDPLDTFKIRSPEHDFPSLGDCSGNMEVGVDRIIKLSKVSAILQSNRSYLSKAADELKKMAGLDGPQLQNLCTFQNFPVSVMDFDQFLHDLIQPTDQRYLIMCLAASDLIRIGFGNFVMQNPNVVVDKVAQILKAFAQKNRFFNAVFIPEFIKRLYVKMYSEEYIPQAIYQQGQEWIYFFLAMMYDVLTMDRVWSMANLTVRSNLTQMLQQYQCNLESKDFLVLLLEDCRQIIINMYSNQS